MQRGGAPSRLPCMVSRWPPAGKRAPFEVVGGEAADNLESEVPLASEAREGDLCSGAADSMLAYILV